MMGVMLAITTIFLLFIFLLFFWRFPASRREMIWAGGLSIPLVLVWSMPTSDTLVRLAFGFLFSGVAAAIYEFVTSEWLKLVAHPHRAKLGHLVVGPVLYLCIIMFGFPVIPALLMGFLAEVAVLAYHRKELVWEAVVAGLFMASNYLVIFTVLTRVDQNFFPTVLAFNYLGVDLLGIPAEALLFVFGYGMLWGPLYEGVKNGKV